MEIGRIGIWTSALDQQPAALAQAAAAELEALGYGAIWLPEGYAREVFANSGLLLAATRRIVIATGIASLWARDALAMASGQKTLAEAYPDRFLLGIGVSHRPMVENIRGHRYERPLAIMRAYLDAMDAAPYRGAPPTIPPKRVLAALRPRMLELAATRAGGAHPYFVPVEHTARARAALGPEALLLPEQAVVLETSPEKARAVAREHMSRYLQLPNYTNNLRWLGYGDDDLANGGSDTLVDAIVAWGDIDTVAARVRAHLDAGANHVCVQALGAAAGAVPMDQWRALAPALLRL